MKSVFPDNVLKSMLHFVIKQLIYQIQFAARFEFQQVRVFETNVHKTILRARMRLGKALMMM